MRRLPLILMGIITLAVIVTTLNAEGTKPARMQFSEFLQGSVAQGEIRQYGEWIAIGGEVITGSGSGDLVGSPITFMIQSDRRFNSEEGKGFVDGKWAFVASEGSSISGNFRGNGTSINEFSGKFVTTGQTKGTGIYSGAKISGEFECQFIEPSSYGESWRYEAWWTGTLQIGE